MQGAEVSHAVRINLVAAADVHRIRKRQPENAAPTENVEAVVLGLGVSHNGIHQTRGLAVEVFVEAGLQTLRELCDPGRHGDGVAAERAGLVHRTGRRDVFHDFGARGVGAYGKASADDLAKRQHVRLDVVQARRTFKAHAETADDFIKQEQNAFSCADATHLPQEIGILDEEAIVGGDGFDGDNRDLVFVLGDARLERLEVVQREDQGFAGVGFGHARGRGRAEGGQATARLHEQGIDVAVVAPVELDDFVPARDAACQANGGHGGFRAGRHKANAVDVPVVGQNQFSKFVLEARRRTERGAVGQRGRDAVHDRRMRMAQDEWSPRAAEVDELVAVGIPNVGALALVHEQRRSTDRFESPHRRVHAAGKQGLGLVEQSRRRRALEGRCHFSAKLAQHERASHPEAARELDSADPLSRFRSRFHIPQHDGADTMYFTGNSLGLQPKDAKAALEVELDDWAKWGVEGHFQGQNPWVSYHERFVDGLCHLTGAKPHEVVAMNGLTVNLHLLLISFTNPRARAGSCCARRRPSPATGTRCAVRFACTAGTLTKTSSNLPLVTASTSCARKMSFAPSRKRETNWPP